MSIEDVAGQAIRLWDRDEAIVMVAIAGPESAGTYSATIKGDPASNYPNDPQYAQWSYLGFTSFGPWQINIRWNHATILNLSGYDGPAAQATWLMDYERNAIAANAIRQRQGHSAWSAFNGGQYLAYVARATAAVDAALGQAPTPSPQPPTETPIAEFHYVVAGDTLYSIASRAYGNGDLWPGLYWRNYQEIGPDPNLLKVGAILAIPTGEEVTALTERWNAGQRPELAPPPSSVPPSQPGEPPPTVTPQPLPTPGPPTTAPPQPEPAPPTEPPAHIELPATTEPGGPQDYVAKSQLQPITAALQKNLNDLNKLIGGLE